MFQRESKLTLSEESRDWSDQDNEDSETVEVKLDDSHTSHQKHVQILARGTSPRETGPRSEKLSPITIPINQSSQNPYNQNIYPPRKFGRERTFVQRQTLLTRADFMNNIKIPKSNETRVIIPSNPLGNSFKTNCYDEKILCNIISEEEFRQVITQLSRIAQMCYSKKRLLDNSHVSQNTVIMYHMSLVVVLVFSILMYYGSVQSNPWMIWTGIFLIVAAALMITGVIIKHFFIDFKDIIPNFELMVKKELDDYFYKINKHYVQRGLWWRAVPGHYWIELRIDQNMKDEVQRNQDILREASGTVHLKVDESGINPLLGIKNNASVKLDVESVGSTPYTYRQAPSQFSKTEPPSAGVRRRTHYVYQQQYIEEENHEQKSKTVIINKGRKNSYLVRLNQQVQIQQLNNGNSQRNSVESAHARFDTNHNFQNSPKFNQNDQYISVQTNENDTKGYGLNDSGNQLIVKFHKLQKEEMANRSNPLTLRERDIKIPQSIDQVSQREAIQTSRPSPSKRRESNLASMINNPVLLESSLPEKDFSQAKKAALMQSNTQPQPPDKLLLSSQIQRDTQKLSVQESKRYLNSTIKGGNNHSNMSIFDEEDLEAGRNPNNRISSTRYRVQDQDITQNQAQDETMGQKTKEQLTNIQQLPAYANGSFAIIPEVDINQKNYREAISQRKRSSSKQTRQSVQVLIPKNELQQDITSQVKQQSTYQQQVPQKYDLTTNGQIKAFTEKTTNVNSGNIKNKAKIMPVDSNQDSSKTSSNSGLRFQDGGGAHNSKKRKDIVLQSLEEKEEFD